MVIRPLNIFSRLSLLPCQVPLNIFLVVLLLVVNPKKLKLSTTSILLSVLILVAVPVVISLVIFLYLILVYYLLLLGWPSESFKVMCQCLEAVCVWMGKNHLQVRSTKTECGWGGEGLWAAQNILSVTLAGLDVIVCDRQGKEMPPREQSDTRAKKPLS